MKGYKGFESDLTCRGFQYQIGKEYTIAQPIGLCGNGFHFCESPLDVFSYYDPKPGRRYCEVEATGKTVTDGDKTVTDGIKIVREISLLELYEEHFALIFSGHIDSQTSGNYAHSQTSGNEAHSQTSGYKAHSQTSGNEAIACSLGYAGRAKSQLGWIIIVDWQEEDGEDKIKGIYSAPVGGEIKGVKISPDTWYWFEKGELRYEKTEM